MKNAQPQPDEKDIRPRFRLKMIPYGRLSADGIPPASSLHPALSVYPGIR